MTDLQLSSVVGYVNNVARQPPRKSLPLCFFFVLRNAKKNISNHLYGTLREVKQDKVVGITFWVNTTPGILFVGKI